MPLAQRPPIRLPRGTLDVPLTWGGVALRRDERPTIDLDHSLVGGVPTVGPHHEATPDKRLRWCVPLKTSGGFPPVAGSFLAENGALALDR